MGVEKKREREKQTTWWSIFSLYILCFHQEKKKSISFTTGIKKCQYTTVTLSVRHNHPMELLQWKFEVNISLIQSLKHQRETGRD